MYGVLYKNKEKITCFYNQRRKKYHRLDLPISYLQIIWM